MNVALPLALPFVGIAAIKLAPTTTSSNLFNQVKDGQLNWISVGMCSAALYEQSDARRICMNFVKRRSEDLIPPWWDVLQATLVISVALSFLLAASGAVFITNPPSLPTPWYKHYKVFVSSLFLIVVSIVQYEIVHGASSPGCTSLYEGFTP